MARMRRLKYRDPRDGYYHLISRTVLKSFLLDDESREVFMGILRMLVRVYFVRVVTFSLMSNHFHLIVRMQPSDDIDDKELEERFNAYYNEGKQRRNWRPYHPAADGERYRRRFSDLSRFMQDLKQRFSRWYNRRTGNEGHVWSDRFKSVMLEDGRALLACMVYVELNSIRAGLVERPEDFRYCGLSHLVTGGRAASWLDHETLTRLLNPATLTSLVGSLPLPAAKEETDSSRGHGISHSDIKQYLALVYQEGVIAVEGKGQISKDVGEQVRESQFADVGILTLRRRWRHFTVGVFIGGKEFCEQRFNEFRSYFQTSHDRQAHRMASKKQIRSGGIMDLFTMRILQHEK